MPLRVQNAPAAAKKEIGLGLSVLWLCFLSSLKRQGDHQLLPTAANASHRMDPNAQPLPQPGFAEPTEPAANSVPWPAAGHMLMTDILAVYTTPGYGKNTRIGDVRSILDVYGFTNRGRSWERDSLRLYPPENFPQSKEGCIRSFNGLKTYLDSALAEASYAAAPPTVTPSEPQPDADNEQGGEDVATEAIWALQQLRSHTPGRAAAPEPDKATAAARRAWAQIAKPVTEETFTAWYIANVAKEKRDPAPAPPARPGRRPARPTIYEAAIVPEDATKAMSSIARGGGVGPVVTLPLPLPLP